MRPEGPGPRRVLTPVPVPTVEKAKSHLELPLEENLNRRVLDEGSVEARTVEDAIAVLRWAGPAGRGLAGWGGALRAGRGSGRGSGR